MVTTPVPTSWGGRDQALDRDTGEKGGATRCWMRINQWVVL